MHHGPAMRAALRDDLRLAGLAAVERVVLAHDAERLGASGRQVGSIVERHPELAHELTARRSRTRTGDIYVRCSYGGCTRGVGAGFHDATSLKSCYCRSRRPDADAANTPASSTGRLPTAVWFAQTISYAVQQSEHAWPPMAWRAPWAQRPRLGDPKPISGRQVPAHMTTSHVCTAQL